MLRLLAVLVALCWALCIFLRCLPAELGLKEGTQRAGLASSPAKPAGAEWRKIARLPAGRIVALRVQVILV